ncbi:MAG: ABC transporter substrate-binding protein, partial [Chloroflexi bacterium]|nr:ABC transporter substrate-binding protein [Chloroflexota bacterium]
MTWTFKLNPKATWHDGQPVTADDVVFSVEYQTKNAPSFPLRAATELASTTKKSDREVEFKLKQTYAPFLNSFAGAMQIIPKHIWENVTDPKKFRDDKALIGSGPYILKQYNQADGSY